MMQQMVEYPNINERDDKEGFVKWLNTDGRLGTKEFAKHLPNTTEDLLEGKVTPDQVTDDLLALYESNKIKYEGMHGVMIDHDDFHRIAIVAAGAVLPKKMFLRSGLTMEDDAIPRKTSLLVPDIVASMMQKSEKSEDANIFRKRAAIESIVKESVDETCEKWAERLDKDLFLGKKGMFLKTCPAYGRDPRWYSEHGKPLEWYCRDPSYFTPPGTDVVGHTRESILGAVKDAAQGKHDARRVCWECGKMCKGDGHQVCSKCDTARYCSRHCQVAAWKEGHKQKCEALRSKHVLHQTLLEEIGGIHASGGQPVAAEAGIVTCERASFRLARRIMAAGVELSFSNRLETDFGRPSIRMFYDNLGKVVRGEWWYFKESFTAAYERLHVPLESEECIFTELAYYMCFDVIEAMRELNFDGGVARQLAYFFGAAMPASRFISLYRDCQILSSRDVALGRRENMLYITRFLMEHYHK